MKAGLILSRLDSSRLPGKALINLGQKKLLEWPILALKSTNILTPILVTSDRRVDDPLVELAKKHEIRYFRGDLENVASRVKGCLEQYSISMFCRINGDSPFINLNILKSGFDLMEKEENLDFVTNILDRQFPYGISIEVFKSQAFLNHYRELNKHQQEHITSFFYENKANFNYKKISYPENDAHSIRFVVDYFSDLQNLERFLQFSQLENRIHELEIADLVQQYISFKLQDDKSILDKT